MPRNTPRTDANTERFFQLRNSGYTGWIDQDGHPVDDIDQWITDHHHTDHHHTDQHTTDQHTTDQHTTDHHQ